MCSAQHATRHPRVPFVVSLPCRFLHVLLDVRDEYDTGTYFSGERRLRSGLIGTARGALDGYAEAQAVQSMNITFLSSYVVSWCSLCCRVNWAHSSWHTDTPDSHIRTRSWSDPEGVDGLKSVAGGSCRCERTNSSPTRDHEGSDGFTGAVRDGSESSERFTKRAGSGHADGLFDTTAVRVDGLTDTSSLKSAEPVHADGVPRTQAYRDGLVSHSSGQVLTRKRLPTKITVKAEPIVSGNLAIRFDESGFSKSSEFRAQSHLRMSPQVSHTKTLSCAPIKSLTDGSAGDAPTDDQGVQQVLTDLPDIVSLYRTLVADGGLPPGYKVEFSTLGPILESAAKRQEKKIRELSNLTQLFFSNSRKLSKRRMPKI